ncbi:hypothetical protein AABB24_004973 [Solanum stoloniferum]|uniref:Uncharacterized protein n=1 Tax=Solanum stoloniferum TaxID=62892 RepID=A0ABD2UV15_9SOLN
MTGNLECIRSPKLVDSDFLSGFSNIFSLCLRKKTNLNSPKNPLSIGKNKNIYRRVLGFQIGGKRIGKTNRQGTNSKFENLSQIRGGNLFSAISPIPKEERANQRL